MILDKLKQRIRRRFYTDLLFVVITTAAVFAWLGNIDMLELIYHYSREYESWELDELVPTGFYLILALCFFSIRRWRDVQTLSRLSEEQSLRHSITRYPNRRALDRLLVSKVRQSDFPLTLLMIDIIGLRQATMNYGLSMGDELLEKVMQQVSERLHSNELLGHWSSEQLMLFAPAINDDRRRELKQAIGNLSISLSPEGPADIHFICVSVVVESRAKLQLGLEQLEDALYLSHARYIREA
ncbi:diguanylate cyclase domain-containing protein [Bowmanella denitrificans]|uniref:diguanylate cyclase domain-containing protein n=1 Tax=Bowmanella denitrificans TaxID=366582 RepID=UPI000C9982C2|nr:diguanylate cyclase [Bowmanella denitrificans]